MMFNIKKLEKLIVITGLFGVFSFAHANSFDAFFAAVQRDNESAVVGLALREFDINTRNPEGDPALVMALRLGSLKVANFLLDQQTLDIEARNAHDENALMMAALKGHTAEARRLIERGAQVNKPGWAPLHYAASTELPQSLAMARLLLEHHAYIDAESPNGTTPLMMAAFYGTSALVDLLLQEGADPQLRNRQGLTAIDFARRAGRQRDIDAIARVIRQRQPAGRW
ncbi:MAG TPA: ankyrin repeat domain-containing protein [Hydrogenophaga sp.]|uniref:ankyrin repeat domain-containing protein n=1 Tax=Hydrogenophaga sp. TaxID=1904254 RepID=UPI002BFC0056|nr:ankyrin repeat domain-containing protein [Hydrogenophaga sp.]HMN92912.1 ankyrin repeat domain-containing protein [Hydrogenophaga sp.]HMP09785.1 ankyrin repeat domain-containing protein [Hydrogenophaga sp.]